VPKRPLLPIAIAIAALLFGACGGDDQRSGEDVVAQATTVTTEADATSTTATGGTATTDHDGTEPKATKRTIVGRNIAFSPDKFTIPVNVEIEITFDNRDAAVPHNIHFKTPEAVKTDVKNGKADGVKDRFKLKVDKAGTYDFLCDVHPAMKGELTVS
jgi:plastocyanin